MKGRYQLPDGRTVTLDKKALEKCAINTTLYPSEFQFEKAKSFKLKNKFQTEIKVIQGDCLEAALWLKSTKKVNPIVLNMVCKTEFSLNFLYFIILIYFLYIYLFLFILHIFLNFFIVYL